jgi:hypothetical protein
VTATALDDVLTALVARARTISGFVAPDSATTGIVVYDTIEAALVEDGADAQRFLVIGYGGDPEAAPGEAGSSAQTLLTVGTGAREEDGVIGCLAVAQSGDHELGTAAAVRHEAFGIVHALDTYLRTGTNQSLGLVPSYRLVRAWVDRITRLTSYLNEGAVTEVGFDVRFDATV